MPGLDAAALNELEARLVKHALGKAQIRALVAQARRALVLEQTLREACDKLREVSDEFGPGSRDFSTWDTVEDFLRSPAIRAVLASDEPASEEET